MAIDEKINIVSILICFFVVGYFLFQGYRHVNILPKKRFKVWMGLRLTVIIFLICVLLNVEWVHTCHNTTTLFLIDRSLSAEEHREEIEAYINQELLEKKSNDRVGVITFGKEPMVELPISKNVEKIRLETEPDPLFTNIEKTLSFAADYFPEDTNKRIVLFTDGCENIGNAQDMINGLQNQRINLYIYPLENKANTDFQVSSLNIPYYITKGEKVPVEVAVDTNTKGSGVFRLYTDKDMVIEQPLIVQRGRNDFSFKIPVEQEGNIRYTGEIEFKEDTNPKNNFLNTTITVQDEPRVLVIGGKEDTKNIRLLLDSLSIHQEYYTPLRVPSSIDFLSGFQETVLVNVDHSDISKELEKNIEGCVKQQGMGLLVIGGENTFALGGYESTTLEKLLPVSCRMKGNKKQPNTGLILAIDCSGSMEDESSGVKKIEMAKEAAIKAMEILEEDDYIGVLGFSDKLEWIVPFQPVNNKESVQNDIGKLRAKGGTLILPGVIEAENTLEKAEVKVKHIVLLSDGQGEKEGFKEIALKLQEENITLSSVAVGQDAERYLLKDLSQAAGGRSYVAIDFHEIPEIFVKETYLATKKYLNNHTFTPQVVKETDYLKKQELPALKGYIGTGIKEGSDMIIQSNKEDPVLAAWNYYLGKVIVWTSDLSGRWSCDWIEWNDFQSQWGKIISSCLRQHSSEDMEAQIIQNGCNASIYVDAGDMRDKLAVEMFLQGPENLHKKINLKQIRVGEFHEQIVLDKIGDYVLTLRILHDGNEIKRSIHTIHLDYSPEYDINQDVNLENSPLVNEFNVLDKESNLFDLPISLLNKSNRPLEHILLPLALLCFIADIWIRKN